MLKQPSPISRMLLAILLSVGGLSGLQGQQISHGIAAGNINVVQNNTANDPESVTVTTTLSINQFAIRPGSNRGDFNVQVGAGFSDDATTGVLMTCVAENGRDNSEIAEPGINFCTTSMDYTRTGGNAGAYYIPTFNAPAGSEFNINVSAALFPYNKWLGGFARNSIATNGGPNDLFTGSPNLVLGTHFIDNGGGVSTVNLKSLGIDSRTNGVLLVTHGKNEQNYALSFANTNGTWTVYVKDVGSDTDVREQDPVAFVFIPKTNTTVVSGKFDSGGAPLVFSGQTPAFTVTNIAVGTWRLTVAGHSPSSGVLITSPEGGSSQNQDNIISYRPDGDGWIIQSRDLPGDPPGLQSPNGPVASFVFIPAAILISRVAPGETTTNLGAAPLLQVSVTNTAAGNLNVQFYGRKALPSPGPDFTIALLPDTQFYSGSLNGGVPAMFYAQTEWIITNRVERNIAYVAHLGDISQNGDIKSGGSNVAEWRVATNAMYRLENPTRTLLTEGIPYGAAVGNHDQEPIGTADGTTIFYNQYFGISHFQNRPYYAGHYGTNNDNHFDFFEAGGLEFVVLYFEYDNDANPDVLAWGDNVLRTNAHRRAIVVTHNFGNTSTPISFSAQGAAIYNALKTNANLFLMLAGHVTGEGARVDTFNGNVVRTFVQDFQGWTNGGNGFMRTMEFSPSNNQVLVQTFSPYTGEYETDGNSEFFFDYNMDLPSAPEQTFALIGTRSNLPPGTVVSLPWPNREPNTTYEWYAVVTDSAGNSTTGPIWRFTTGTNSAPTASPRVVAVTGDSITNLFLVASDGNGDPLLYQTNSRPNHGLAYNFNPSDGNITYRPIHGFRGLDQINFQASDSVATSAVTALYLNVVSPPDTNENGLPDYWEINYGVTNPDADNDGDGETNLEEYFAHTNPTNAASLLRITNASRNQQGHVTLQWSSVGNTRYRVQYSNGTNGSFEGVFTDIIRSLDLELTPGSDDVTSTGSFVDDFSLTSGTTNQARYYRLKIVQ